MSEAESVDMQADADFEEEIQTLLFEMHRHGEVSVRLNDDGVAYYELAESAR